MTRRERLERKLELRQDWAAKRTAKANVVFAKAEHHRDDHAFNTQPGHIPERARLIKAEDRAFADMDMAKHHESCAKGIETALDKSIFSDDSDAVEALEQRIAEREAEREQMKLVNRLYRKGDAAGLAAIGKDLEQMRARLKDQLSWMQVPYPAYELSNLGGRITADRKRLEYIKQQTARKAKAEESPNGVTIETGENWHGYCRVTFAEKPDREILNALRSAGFNWGAGSWSGKTDQLPKEVKDMTEAKQEPPAVEPKIIKGCPSEKWDEVQAIQHEPFIYIQHNGSHWLGEEPDDVAILLEVLRTHKLDPYWAECGPSINPCRGVANPDWTPDFNNGSVGKVERWIDGPRLYACDGVVQFSGNFVDISHAFGIATNHKPTIDALMAAFEANKAIAA